MSTENVTNTETTTETVETVDTVGTTATDTNDENIIGSLDPEEVQTLETLRNAANSVVQEVGQIEVRKARLLGSLSDIENRAQEVLNSAARRLNIPEGTAWQVTPEGTARIMGDSTTTQN
jgi:hypothetical protein